ncbi:urease accessory protein UreD [aff. Roholtiella sp. LEGE 12411]|uniref:urease accessory protein UreD n=1 Tax=aff. Roholtiella sp. LEGE 12411 TaxID=1828822 RepID=UPI00188305E4|nr:urease accessory protein UreD [aff. Roholtiella sp. LEGE 12411]MBE9038988.1 urease accessory protein UreD [aff. Roholtiella sp. LEGE 12411]
MKTLKKTKNLELRLECDRNGYTIVSHQYTAYPLGISRTFRSDLANPEHTYLYITSSSPGLLANDQLNISLQLAANTHLYLTDQSATKVHPMPGVSSKATAHYEIEIGEGATLEFIPEPIILFKDATLEQTTCIKCHPQAKLFLSEIIVPGRLARGEFYDFNYYSNRLQVTSWEGELWFTDAMRLEGKHNDFKNCQLFASSPILSNLIVVLPQTNLQLLSNKLENIEAANCVGVIVASSILPQSKGLLIRAIASGTHGLKNYLQYALKCVRDCSHQPVLPSISQ